MTDVRCRDRFTTFVATDGRLPTGQELNAKIREWETAYPECDVSVHKAEFAMRGGEFKVYVLLRICCDEEGEID